MGSTTTLMTFLVRCPPTTRTVTLLGSWDNFTKPYPMQRDTRVGSEHWRGCHSFSNIICDGNMDSLNGSRNGGLKMGGTYWYYYQLDGEIEFHDSAEPATTSCPLMPGQLVNVLHVPFHFSGRRHDRNQSTSSVNSEVMTMDPAMKFLNPRPAPPPRLPRLKTSPPLLQVSDAFEKPSSRLLPLTSTTDSTGRSQSQPSSATSQRRFQLPRNRQYDIRSRSPSPHRQGGFMATLRQIATKLGEIERGEDKVHHPLTATRSRELVEPSTSSSLKPVTAYNVGYPKDSIEGDHVLGGQQRSLARSREPSPLRKPLYSSTEQVQAPSKHIPNLGLQIPTFDVAKDTSSRPSSTLFLPDAGQTGFSNPVSPYQINQDKRLPTLPNSPSSAIDPMSSPKSFDEDIFRSHFSALTVSTSSSSSPVSPDTKSVFNLNGSIGDIMASWASDGLASPTSEALTAYHSPYILPSMPQTPTTEQHDSYSDLSTLPSELSSSTISTQDTESSMSASGTFSGLGIENADIERDARRQAGCFSPSQVFQYRLPSADDSPVDSKYGRVSTATSSDRKEVYSPVAVRRHDSISESTPPTFDHSTGMQDLINELSYLGGMINT